MKEEEKPKKKRKKKTAEEGEKVHRKNWREEYATVEDIKTFLGGRLYLRHNVVTGRVECRVPEADTFSDSRLVAADWQPVNDRIVNSLWAELSKEKLTRAQDIYRVIESDFVPAYHPFRYYLDHLPPWNGRDDYILELSVSVSVKGGTDEQLYFYELLKRWLVGMVASWLDEDTVNQAVLVFIGEQGLYKTTWFSMLLPPELHDYFRIKVNASKVSKDDLITLSQYGLVCYEELDTMRPTEVNTMKSVVTMPAIDERRPFGHYTEHMPHVASFCGTGNNVQFLNDATGNRRWLPFLVERIDDPRAHPFNHAGIFAQAYALYRQGFRHYFTKAEEERLKAHNRTFETPCSEQEAISKHFRLPNGGEHGEFYTATDIQLVISEGPALRFPVEKIGSAMKVLGFAGYRSHGRRGYRVVRYKIDEIEANRRLLASDAEPENETAGDSGDSAF